MVNRRCGVRNNARNARRHDQIAGRAIRNGRRRGNDRLDLHRDATLTRASQKRLDFLAFGHPLAERLRTLRTAALLELRHLLLELGHACRDFVVLDQRIVGRLFGFLGRLSEILELGLRGLCRLLDVVGGLLELHGEIANALFQRRQAGSIGDKAADAVGVRHVRERRIVEHADRDDRDRDHQGKACPRQIFTVHCRISLLGGCDGPQRRERGLDG
jgi:hypothetical protein